MNYRHIFHAGNRCDVIKHSLLALVLKRLRDKDKAFAVLDTHAGAGLYELEDARAQTTGEAAEGIVNLLKYGEEIPHLTEYLDVLKKLNPQWKGLGSKGFSTYPGSPLLTYRLLREQDRLIACELHPEDAKELKSHTPADKRLQIHCRDGYEALKAFLPPPEKRGLILIDPPYEQPNEFGILSQNLAEAYRKWPTGIYMAWYPIKDRPAIWAFHESLIASGIEKILRADFVYDANAQADSLSGSGMIIVNPPWKLEENIKELFPILHKALQTPHENDTVEWLTRSEPSVSEPEKSDLPVR